MKSKNLKGGVGLSSTVEGVKVGGEALELKKLREPKKYNSLNINKFYHLTSSRKLLYDGPINMKIQKPVSETRYWALAEVLISFKMLKGKQI